MSLRKDVVPSVKPILQWSGVRIVDLGTLSKRRRIGEDGNKSDQPLSRTVLDEDETMLRREESDRRVQELMDNECDTQKMPGKRKTSSKCSVPQCSSLINPLTLKHKMPKDPVRRKKWEIAIRFTKEWKEHHRVCSEHFLKEDYLPTGKGTLKNTAVPSQNLPSWSHETIESSPQIPKSADMAAARLQGAKKRALQCADHLDSTGLVRRESC